MNKRITSLVLVLAMCLTMLPSALAEQTDTADYNSTGQSDIYTINSDAETHDAAEDDTEPIDSSTAVAEIGGTKYASLPEAFAAASNYDDTITLLNNTELAEPLSVSLNDYYVSHFTLDLNGKMIRCNNGDSDTLFVSAALAICDSSSEQTGKITKNANFAVRVGSGGTLTVTGGSFEMLCVNDYSSAEISGGTFEYITSDNGNLANLLKKGYAFQDSDGNLINGYENTNATYVTVVEHKTHAGSTCACGYTCDHSNGMDSTTGLCNSCGEVLANASVTADGANSYYTDIRAAFDAAKISSGSTLTLLQDVTLAQDDSIYLSTDNDDPNFVFTVDWNGHTLSGNVPNLLTFSGRISVTLKDSSNNTGGVHNNYDSSAAVCLSLSGYEHTATIEGGTYFPKVYKSSYCTGIIQISDGVFQPSTGTALVADTNGTLSNLLAEGYTFAYDESGTRTPFNVYSDYFSAFGKTVYVVPHTHKFDENNKCVCGYTCPHTSVDENNNCTLCGKQMAAIVM